MGKRKKRKKDGKRRLTAETADRHALYQAAVQNPEFEVELASKLFEERAGRPAVSLREDFCGTAILCSRWVASHPERTATGVDIDPEVLEWGRVHNIAPLGDDAARVRLIEGDVRDPDDGRHDIVVAFNYSYFCFKDRATLRGYFEAARSRLADGGLLLLDLFGGWEAVQVLKEKRKLKGFKYIWDQSKYDPIHAHFVGHIHFEFKDKSRIDEAFTYDWRLWTIPELRELLAEAGFGRVEVLWEGEDEDGEGNGEFEPVEEVENDPGYNSYLAASV